MSNKIGKTIDKIDWVAVNFKNESGLRVDWKIIFNKPKTAIESVHSIINIVILKWYPWKNDINNNVNIKGTIE